MNPEISSAAGGQQTDRISALPDEIIHDILSCLRSPKQPAEVSILSKRWSHLWQSYPILEIDDDLNEIAAVLRKFSKPSKPAVEAIRITLSHTVFAEIPYRFFRCIRNSGATIRELDIHMIKFGQYQFGLLSAFILVVLGFFSDNKNWFPRLEVLKLRGFSFRCCSWFVARNIENNGNPFPSLGGRSSLRVLCFDEVEFDPVEDQLRTLNMIVACSPLLESLTLTSVRGIGRFEVRNHPNLKSIKAEDVDVESFEITGAPSLETLCLSCCEIDRLQVWFASNLKLLCITN